MGRSKRIQYFRFVLAYNIVMMVPIVVISLSVLFLLHKQQQQKITDEMSIVMERQVDFWGQQMSVVRAFNTSCKYDKKYNERYSDVPEVYLDIQKELSKQEENLPLADSIYLYDKGKGLIISANGNIQEDLFFTEICRMDQSVFEMEGDTIGACIAYLRTDSRPGITLVAPIKSYGLNETVMKYLLYTIKSENWQYNSEGTVRKVAR